MADLKGLPEGLTVWNLTDAQGRQHAYVVTHVPGTQIPIAWHVNKAEDLAGLYGPNVQYHTVRTESLAGFQQRGGLIVGVLGDIENTDEDLFDGLVERFRREAAIKPYLRDPSVLASIAEAAMEGRAWDAETDLPMTKWWQSRTPGEREWALLAASDPRAAAQRSATGEQKVRELLARYGITKPTGALVDALRDRWVEGKWTEEQLIHNIRRSADPYAVNATNFNDLLQGGWHGIWGTRHYLVKDGKRYLATNETQIRDLKALYGPGAVATKFEHLGGASGISFGQLQATPNSHLVGRIFRDTTRLGGEEDVRTLLNQWLGPLLAKGYTDEWVSQWAGRIRNAGEGEQDVLIEQLRNVAKNVWGTPEDYESRASAWRGFYQRYAGVSPDEANDALFWNIVKDNDAVKADSLLRDEGIAKGWLPTVQAFLSESSQALGAGAIAGAR